MRTCVLAFVLTVSGALTGAAHGQRDLPPLPPVNPTAQELNRLIFSAHEGPIEPLADAIVEILSGPPDLSAPDWGQVEKTASVGAMIWLRRDAGAADRLRTVMFDLETLLETLLTEWQDGAIGNPEAIFDAERAMAYYAERWSYLASTVGNLEDAIAWWERMQTAELDTAPITGFIGRRVFDAYVARGDWSRAGEVLTDPVTSAEQFIVLVTEQTEMDRQFGRHDDQLARFTSEFLDRQSQVYGALLAGGREEEAAALAGVMLDDFPTIGHNLCVQCSLVEVALLAGEPRDEHLMWLGQATAADPAVLADLQDRLGAALTQQP